MGLIELAGKTALITGAAKRVGRSIAIALADQGANTIVHCNTSKTGAEALADQLRAGGVQACALQANLDDPVEIQRLWRRATAWAPQGRISLLVNNASIFPSDTLETLTAESLEQNLSVNTLAPLQLIDHFSAQDHCTREQPGGVVNLLDSRIGGYMKKHVSYALSKRMLFSLTRMLALELAPRVRINAVAPGMILPPERKPERGGGEELVKLVARAPLGRWGQPEDVANAVIFLLRNDYITGQVIFTDGGAFIKEDLYG